MSARSVLACWDNSTRGLDASSALEFAKALRLTTNLMQDAAVVAIYQAGERVYEGTRRLYFAYISIRQSNSPL
jgi:ATP-binding cassette, subfamily G (WHITE), member 2, SNQ2